MRCIQRQSGAPERGFSLLEVMICLVIIAVAATTFLATLTRNVQLEAMNAETNIAVNAARGVIELAQGLSYAEVSTISPTFEASGLTTDGHTRQLTDADGSTAVGHVTVTEVVGGNRKIVEVEVIWRSATGRDRSIMLMTEVTNY
jgi:prepilin-type N-terminal cleavage/methylation domain-containing protein